MCVFVQDRGKELREWVTGKEWDGWMEGRER